MALILVVGAGFAGSVIARSLAEAGLAVHVIDKRPHLAGNAFDSVNQYGERLHAYGPHLLHADSSSQAISWLSRFTEWVRYEHRVRALLPDGRTTPLPVNRTTLEDVFNIRLNSEAEAKKFLDKEIVQNKIENTDDFFLANVGPRLADLFFRPYTKKMWGRSPKELEAAVGARLPVRLSRDDRYFTDSFQAMPKQGFTALFENILDHKNIKTSLSEPYSHDMYKNYDYIFTSASIDWHFNYIYGKLPYRSIIFEHIEKDINQQAPVVNFTDDGIYTRITQWDLISNSKKRQDSMHTFTKEIPCDPSINNEECYYPVRNPGSINLYEKYRALASLNKKLTFIGRTGMFVYIDMVPCVTRHLEISRRFLGMGLRKYE